MGLIFSKNCILCGEALDIESGKAMLCPSCAQKVRQQYRCVEDIHIHGVDDAAVPLYYTGAIAGAMKRFKFMHRQHYADWFAAQMLPLLAERLDDWQPDLITYIPISFFRWYQRGYNQSELLAKPIAEAFSLPCCATLQKRLLTPKQSSRKSADERKKNAAHAFRSRNDVNLSGMSVVLVDDIITTGATVSAAAKCLREMGAKRVFLLASTKTP